MTDAFITDTTKTWSPTPVSDGFSYTPSTAGAPVPGDIFARILGASVTNSQVTYDGTVTYSTAHQTEWGSYIFLYGTNQGIKGIYSNDGGMHWSGTDNIYARDANCPLLIGRYLFYITSSGIMVKEFSLSAIGQVIDLAMKKLAGTSIASDEIVIQGNFDNTSLYPRRLIGSGEVDPQRLSGYVTDDGIIKLFFYDSENLLKCMESSGAYEWEVSNNY